VCLCTPCRYLPTFYAVYRYAPYVVCGGVQTIFFHIPMLDACWNDAGIQKKQNFLNFFPWVSSITRLSRNNNIAYWCCYSFYKPFQAAIECPCIHTLYYTNTIDPILFLLINNYVPWWSCTSITILYYLYYYRYHNKK